MTLLIELDRAIKVVCPIHGVSIGRKDDRSTWRIDFKAEATPAQRAAAETVLADYDELDALRADKWAALKAARDAERDAGFVFNLKPVQSDPISRDNISGAAQAAGIAKAAGQPFAVQWTCADNSVMVLDADQAIAMFMAGVQHMQALYAKGVQLREQLGEAVTEEDIEAVSW
jgi:hypothetical protein